MHVKTISRRCAGLPTLLLAGLASIAMAQIGPAPAAPQIGQVSKDSVWVPTPDRMIRRMLQLAEVTPADVVMDLGSGDGRIPIHAAKHFGARAIGVELEENLVRLSIESARAQGVSHLVRFVRQDLFEADLSQATVFALYISPGVMSKLKPRLLALRPGTRVASHHFTLEDWEPDEVIRTEGRTGYLWVVPADARGTWTVTMPGDRLTVRIGQIHQLLTTRGERDGRPVNVVGARLRGARIEFTAFDADGSARRYSGRIDGGSMSGESEGLGVRPRRWIAVRD